MASINDLRSVVENLTPSDQKFARSLLEQYDRRQSLSVKQWPYVQSLYEKAVKPAPTQQDLPVTNIGAMGPLIELFDNAKRSGIKFPKIRFDHEDHSIVLSLAGPNARFPGTINVVCDEVWLGRVSRDGFYTNPRRTVEPINVKEVLTKLAADPLEEMKLYGRRTGNCCLCGRTLTNESSIEAGIGPICAGNWGV